MAQKNFDILIRAIDQASPTLDRVSRNAARSQANIVRQAGDVGEVTGVKKIGKIFGDVMDSGKDASIRRDADVARLLAYKEYRKDIEEVWKLDQLGLKNDQARLAAAILRREVAKDQAKRTKELTDAVARADANEASALRFANVSKVAGAFGIAELGGRAMQSAGNRMSAIGQDAVAQNAGPLAIAGEAARAIPGVGTLAKGFDSMRDGARDVYAALAKSVGASERMVQYLQSGTGALKSATAEAEKLDKLIDRRNKARDTVRGLAAEGIGSSDRPGARIETINREIVEIQKRYATARNEAIAAGGTSQEDLAKLNRAELLAIEQKRRDIQKIYDGIAEIETKNFTERQKAQRDYLDKTFEFNRELVSITRDTGDRLNNILTNGLRESGDTQEANLRDIRQQYEKQRQVIRDEIAKTLNDRTLSPEQRNGKVGALQTQLGVTDQEEGQATQQATRTGREERLSKLAGIEREILGIRSAQGSVSASIDAKRLEIAERYKAIEEDITKALGDRNLTEDQRNRLLEQRGSLAGLLARDLRDAGDRATVVQGQQRAGAVDGRFQTASVAQNAQVEVLRQAQQHFKNTAENTQKTATSASNIEQLMGQLLTALTGA